MKKLVVVLLLAAAVSNCKTVGAGGDSELRFYGKDNKQAMLKFESYIEVNIPPGARTPNDVLTGTNRRTIQRQIELQVRHIFAVLTEQEAFVETPGIISEKMKPEIKSAEFVTPGNKVRVHYKFEDVGVFHNGIFKKEPRGEITFYLPKDPDNIYAATSVELPGRRTWNYCTDQHYNSEGDFWYFWNPAAHEKCLLQDKVTSKFDEKLLVKVNAKLSELPSTKITYPYYSKIRGDNGNGRKFRIDYIVGVDEDIEKVSDLGRKTFRDSLTKLRAIDGLKEERARSSDFEKIFTLSNNVFDLELVVKLIDPSDDRGGGAGAFVKTAVDAMENSDVFIYDGHSGLGGYLSVEGLQRAIGRPLNLPKEKSQIFFFNGCSTYAYYNHDYFDLKKTTDDPKGTKNLDIITTAIGAEFTIGSSYDAFLIESMIKGQKRWQTIMDKMYSFMPESTALTHVNGDEDNPTRPN